MKKTLLLAVALMSALMANAQVSVQVGFLSNIVKTEAKETGRLSGAYKGVTASVDYNFHITDYLGIAPGLGVDYSFNNVAESRYRELGLLAPIDVNYYLLLSDTFSLSLFAGPTFYYGLISKETGVNPAYDYYLYDNKRFDAFLGGGFWVDIMEHTRVKVGYKFGLTNNSKIEGITEKNNFVSVSVGYVF